MNRGLNRDSVTGALIAAILPQQSLAIMDFACKLNSGNIAGIQAILPQFWQYCPYSCNIVKTGSGNIVASEYTTSGNNLILSQYWGNTLILH